eukprot:12729945-Ditylum_brightwellii.AAC.1
MSQQVEIMSQETSRFKNMSHQKMQKNIMITMAYATMTQTSATSLSLAESTFSPRTISQNSRGSGKFSLLRTLKSRPRNVA